MQNPILPAMMNFNFLKKKSFGIDLGNNNTVVSDEENVLIAQPTYIVIDKSHNSVRAVGEDAYDMFEKTHPLLKPVKPMKGGVIADHDSAMKLLSAFMRKAYTSKSVLDGYDNLIAGVPYNTTNVEKRALRSVVEQFNASSLSLLHEPIAAAIGMDLNIEEPDGKMVVDIGGGITEIVVISLSGVASFQSLKVAGDSMDEDIQHYFRRKYNMAIGLKTAEVVKIRVGAVLEDLPNPPEPMMVKGKDLVRGIPITRRVDHAEVCRIIEKSVTAIELGIIQTLEKCPPELAGDIYGNGIYLTGGNACLHGLKERLERKTKLRILVDPAPLLSVSRGMGKVLRNRKKYKPVLLQ